MAWIFAGDILGTLDMFHVNETIASVYRLFVRPSARRQGIATKLMQRALVIAAGSGCQGMEFLIEPTSRQFYEACGFTVAKKYPDDKTLVAKISFEK